MERKKEWVFIVSIPSSTFYAFLWPVSFHIDHSCGPHVRLCRKRYLYLFFSSFFSQAVGWWSVPRWFSVSFVSLSHRCPHHNLDEEMMQGRNPRQLPRPQDEENIVRMTGMRAKKKSKKKSRASVCSLSSIVLSISLCSPCVCHWIHMSTFLLHHLFVCLFVHPFCSFLCLLANFCRRKHV